MGGDGVFTHINKFFPDLSLIIRVLKAAATFPHWVAAPTSLDGTHALAKVFSLSKK